MRRLRDFQFVSLSAGESTTGCRVVAVGGDEAVLATDPPGLPGDVALPCRALLGFDTERHPVMLSGMADDGPIPGTVRFFVTDAIGVRQWRLSPRLAAAVDIIVAPSSRTTDAAVMARRLQTVDISAGGAFVAGMGGEAGSTWNVRMTIPGLTTDVECVARVVRATPQGAAVAFEELDPEVGAAIEEVIYTVRLQLARRTSQAAADRARGAARPISR